MLRILLLTAVLPWPLRRNGGAQRTALLRDALARHGTVDVLGVGDAALRDATPDFDRRLADAGLAGCVVITPPALRSSLPGPLGGLARVVRQFTARYDQDPVAAAALDTLMAARPYDLVVSRYLAPAMQAGLARYTAVPTLLDFDDVDYATLADGIRANPWPGLGGAIGSRLVVSRVRARCRIGLRMFDHAFITCEEDRPLVVVGNAGETLTVLPNIPFADPTDGGWLEPLPDQPASRELLFVGDLAFPPNREGLNRFLLRVWTPVRERVPEATLTIVGRGLDPADRDRWSAIDGVRVIGFAPDLVERYRAAAFTIVPVYFGGGTKIKVLESLAFGRAVVTTPMAMRGYEVLRNAVAVAEDDARFAAACVELLTCPERRVAFARHGRAGVTQHFSPGRFESIVDAAVRRLTRQ